MGEERSGVASAQRTMDVFGYYLVGPSSDVSQTAQSHDLALEDVSDSSPARSATCMSLGRASSSGVASIGVVTTLAMAPLNGMAVTEYFLVPNIPCKR